MAAFLIRPVREADLAGLLRLAKASEGGLTTLPNDPDFLRNRIFESLHSFDPRIRRPGDHSHLFVLEDLEAGQVVGTSGILCKVGGYHPFYTYRTEPEVYSYHPLGIHREFRLLRLRANHDGPSEICSLFLLPEYRKGGLGRLLSLCRFHFMAAFPERFEREVISEMRGRLDEDGRSPFWEAIGRHFFQQDFHSANFLSGLGNKEFVASLMPRHPLFVALLPADAQAVLGRVHRQTEPALKMLLSEGFTLSGEVDIFDAGPLLKSRLSSIRTVRELRQARIGRIEGEAAWPPAWLVSNAALDFRACLGEVRTLPGGDVATDNGCAAALGLRTGDSIAFSPIASRKNDITTNEPAHSFDNPDIRVQSAPDRRPLAPQ